MVQRRRLFPALPIALLIVLLSACTIPDRRPQPPVHWQDHLAQLQALEHWSVSGKLSLRSSVASETANLNWQQQEQHTHLQLSGPLGVGATTVTSDGRLLEIRRGDERQILDVSTPTAIVLNTGWDLPLRALPYWLKGMPSPDYAIQSTSYDDENGLLHTLGQDDWQVEYQRHEQFQTLILPTRLLITRDDTRVKVILREWQDLSGP